MTSLASAGKAFHGFSVLFSKLYSILDYDCFLIIPTLLIVGEEVVVLITYFCVMSSKSSLKS